MAGQPPENCLWRFASASVAGSSHAVAETPGQDRTEVRTVRSDWLVCGVADGAGSALHSAEGADAALRTFLDTSCRLLSESDSFPERSLRQAALAGREALECLTREMNCELRDLATTLVGVAVHPSGGAAIQIGDGVIGVRRACEGWAWVFWPQHGEFVNTTNFLSDEDFERKLQTSAIPGVVDLALMTDGLERLALEMGSHAVFEPFFEGLLEPLRQSDVTGEATDLSHSLAEFLQSERIRERTDDDLSLIIATTVLGREKASALSRS